MLTKPGQRAALLGVMVIKQKSRHVMHDGLFRQLVYCRLLEEMVYHVVSYLNNYMGQERKPDAGKHKHNNAEHPIWIIDRRTCFLICFVLQCGPKRYLTPQLLRVSFVLDRIVHLPVPSEVVNRRGKRFLNL